MKREEAREEGASDELEILTVGDVKEYEDLKRDHAQKNEEAPCCTKFSFCSILSFSTSLSLGLTACQLTQREHFCETDQF